MISPNATEISLKPMEPGKESIIKSHPPGPHLPVGQSAPPKSCMINALTALIIYADSQVTMWDEKQLNPAPRSLHLKPLPRRERLLSTRPPLLCPSHKVACAASPGYTRLAKTDFQVELECQLR